MADQTLYVDSAVTDATGHAGTSGDPYSLKQFLTDYVPSTGAGDIDTVYFRGTFIEAAGGAPACPFGTSAGFIMSTTRTDNRALSRFIGVSSTGAGAGGSWTVDYADPCVFISAVASRASVWDLQLSNTVFENCKIQGYAGGAEALIGLKLSVGSGMGAYRCSFPEKVEIAVSVETDGCVVANCEIGVGTSSQANRPAIGVAANAAAAVSTIIVNNTIEVNASGHASGAGCALTHGNGVVAGNRILIDGGGGTRPGISINIEDAIAGRGAVLLVNNSIFGERDALFCNGISVQCINATPYECAGRIFCANNIFQRILNCFDAASASSAAMFAVNNYKYACTNDVTSGEKIGFIEPLVALTNEPFTGVDEDVATQDWTMSAATLRELNDSGLLDSIWDFGSGPGARTITHDLFRKVFALKGVHRGA